MLFKNNTELSMLYIGKKALGAVYSGTRLVWEAISSCFGAGYWNNDKPWSNDDAWCN